MRSSSTTSTVSIMAEVAECRKAISKNRKKFGVAKHDTKLFIIHINLFYPCS